MGLSNAKSPKIIQMLCEKMLPPEVKDGGVQDFENAFKDILVQKGRMRACFWYWIQIIQMIPSFIILHIARSSAMIKNYITALCISIDLTPCQG